MLLEHKPIDFTIWGLECE